MKIFLERIRVVKTAECQYCRQVEQLVIDIFAKYKKQKRKKKFQKKALKARNRIAKLTREKKWLANLLANKQAVKPLLGYIMVMEIKGLIQEGGQLKV